MGSDDSSISVGSGEGRTRVGKVVMWGGGRDVKQTVACLWCIGIVAFDDHKQFAKDKSNSN